MKFTEKEVLDALSHVDDPDLKKDLVTLNMIKNIEIDGQTVRFDVELTTPACPLKDMIKNACVNAVKHFVNKDLTVLPNMTSRVTTARKEVEVLPNVKNIVAVASGKGGVGKSTVAANLARSLARSGASVGLLDADIYGPSQPTIFGVQDQKPGQVNGKMEPVMKDGIKIVSIGFLVQQDQAIVWRGPMASSALRQFATDVNWGDLDYLILDLPPGTGDIHLTVAQQFPVSGAVVVTTPQEVALADCRKAINMLLNPNIGTPILGIVENMSYFTPDDQPDKKYHIFGKGGGQALAEKFKLPLLGELPIIEAVRSAGDSGIDISEHDFVRKAYMDLAGALVRQMAVLNAKRTENSVPSN